MTKGPEMKSMHRNLLSSFACCTSLYLAAGCGSADQPSGAGSPSSGSASGAGGAAALDGGAGGAGSSNSGSGSASGAGASGGGAGGGASGAGASAGVGFPGAGTSFAGDPLAPGLGPETADECPAPPDTTTTTQVQSSAKSCFYGDTADPDMPAATIEQVIEVVNDVKVVHIRITFNPTFVDNTYGANAVGWGGPTAEDAGAPMGGKPKPGARGGHTFKDLVGSDHIELELYDGAQTLSLHAKVDYISLDPTSPCGYGTLGVTGGEGQMIVGSASSVLAVATSLDRDLNGCGYCLTESSPATDPSYTPSAEAPNWDYRVVYELWLDAAAFGDAGYGYAVIRDVHASPSKIPGTNTVTVTPEPCPPGWNEPYCADGAGCGTGGSGGGTSDGGGACPPGTVPDLASEGRYCVKI